MTEHPEMPQPSLIAGILQAEFEQEDKLITVMIMWRDKNVDDHHDGLELSDEEIEYGNDYGKAGGRANKGAVLFGISRARHKAGLTKTQMSLEADAINREYAALTDAPRLSERTVHNHLRQFVREGWAVLNGQRDQRR